MDHDRTHPAHVSPDVADGVTTPLPLDPRRPRLDGRARTAGQTWIGWRVQLLPGEVAAAADGDAHARAERTARDERAAMRGAIRGSAGRHRGGQ